MWQINLRNIIQGDSPITWGKYQDIGITPIYATWASYIDAGGLYVFFTHNEYTKISVKINQIRISNFNFLSPFFSKIKFGENQTYL